MPEASKQQLLEDWGRDLPEIFLQALSDPETTKIYIEDGNLLLKRLGGETREFIGLFAMGGIAESAICRIAKNIGVEDENQPLGLSQGKTLIGGTRLHLSAFLPPLMKTPQIALRKTDPKIIALEIVTTSDLFNSAYISPENKLQPDIRIDMKTDMKKELTPLIHHWQCDTKILDAILAFAEQYDSGDYYKYRQENGTFEMNSASYSLTSKPHSLWSLVRTIIDPAITDYLNQGNFWKILGFLSPSFSESVQSNGIWNTQKSIYTVRRYADYPERARNFPPNFVQTLSSLDFLLSSIARCERTQNIGLITRPDGVTRRTLKHKANTDHFPYCELCWRLSAFAQAANDGDPTSKVDKEDKARDLSRRFCEEHDPSININKKSRADEKKDKKNFYRTDLKYKDAFHAKISECYRVLCWHRGTYDEQDIEIRRFAYEFVRLSANSIKVMQMKREGLRQKDIAIQLKILPPAVSKHLKNLPDYFKDLMASSLLTKSSARKCV